MALSQKHRSSLFLSLAPMVGEDEAEAMLSQFPSTDLDLPATKEFVRAEVETLRTELLLTKHELRSEMADLRADLRAEMADLRVEMNQRFHAQLVWLVGVAFSMLAVILTAMALMITHSR